MRLKGLILAGIAAVSIPHIANAQTLTEALAAAYRSNPALMAERERLLEVDEDWVQARALGRTSANANVDITPQIVRADAIDFLGDGLDNVGGSETTGLVSRQAGVEVIQPLYQGGLVSASRRRARSGVQAARESLRDTEQELMRQVADAYADVVRNREAERIRRNNVRVLLQQKEASTARFEVGAGSRTDIAQADARLAQAEIGLAQARAQLSQSRDAVARLTGIAALDPAGVPRFALPTTLEEALRLSGNNPQLQAAYLAQDAADAGVDVAKSNSRPKVSLNGQIGVLREQLGIPSDAESAQVTARVVIPLLAGGANRSRVRQAKSALNRANFEARETERAVAQNVRQVWSQIEAQTASILAARRQIEAAELAFEGVELEQEVGVRTALDVLDAEQELLEARLNNVDAERERDRSVFALLALLGAFDARALQLPVETLLPELRTPGVRDDRLSSRGATRAPIGPVLQPVMRPRPLSRPGSEAWPKPRSEFGPGSTNVPLVMPPTARRSEPGSVAPVKPNPQAISQVNPPASTSPTVPLSPKFAPAGSGVAGATTWLSPPVVAFPPYDPRTHVSLAPTPAPAAEAAPLGELGRARARRRRR